MSWAGLGCMQCAQLRQQQEGCAGCPPACVLAKQHACGVLPHTVHGWASGRPKEHRCVNKVAAWLQEGGTRCAGRRA